MADQPFSVYYALDGPDLDGLVGSAGTALTFLNNQGMAVVQMKLQTEQTLFTNQPTLEAH